MRIAVCVFRRADRMCYEAQWRDPVTGRKRTRSTGEVTRGSALRVAARIAVELEGTDGESIERLTWEEFRQRYEAEALSALALKSQEKGWTALNHVEKHIGPKYLAAMTSRQVSVLQSRLRATGLAESSLKSTLSAVRAALNWAVRMNYLKKLPAFDMPKRTATMKGRAPTREEFERIRDKAAAVVGMEHVASWHLLLDGLWLSGLRLGEAMDLHWTDDSRISIDFSGRRPMFRVQPGAEKAGKFRMLPIAPEFAMLLAAVPEDARYGYVFDPQSPEGLERLSSGWVSKRISLMGELAGVKVAERTGRDAEGRPRSKVKYASAHDFRRAFGTRWAQRVMPVVLMELMRHESIQTTMEFYVSRNAAETADVIWRAVAEGEAALRGDPAGGQQ